jgi:hypothetical protein
MMKFESKRSCNARCDWKRFSYSVTWLEAPSWSRLLVRLIVLLKGDEDNELHLKQRTVVGATILQVIRLP